MPKMEASLVGSQTPLTVLWWWEHQTTASEETTTTISTTTIPATTTTTTTILPAPTTTTTTIPSQTSPRKLPASPSIPAPASPPSSPAAPSDQTAPGFIPAACSEQYLWRDQQVRCRCSKPLLEWCWVRRHLEDWLHHLRAARGQGVLQFHGDGAGLPGHSR